MIPAALPLAPSRRAGRALILLYLLLLWPAAGVLSALWQWAILLPVWAFALWQSLKVAARVTPLRWQSDELYRGEAPCQWHHSRVLPGMLWLHFADGSSLLLFCDQIADEHYRLLARRITLAAPSP